MASILDFLSKKLKKEYSFSKRRLRAMTRDVIYSNEKIVKLLNIKKEIGIENGIEKTISWYKKFDLL